MTTTTVQLPMSSPTLAKEAATLPVHTLICHAHVDLALACLKSLLRYSADPFSLILHEDGSLTPEDHKRLDAGLNRPRIIDRTDADSRMHEILRPFPALQRFRQSNLFALKILDVCLLTDDPIIAYCDCDVLFLKRFSNLYRIPEGAGGIMMQDAQSAYSIRSWHLLSSPSLCLAKDANAGLLCLHRKSMDLPLLNSFVARPLSSTKEYFTEQTCWAILAHAYSFQLYDAHQVAFPSIPVPPEAIAFHVVGGCRAMMPDLLKNVPTGSAPAPLTTHPVRRCRFHHLALYESRRIFERILRKLCRKP